MSKKIIQVLIIIIILAILGLAGYFVYYYYLVKPLGNVNNNANNSIPANSNVNAVNNQNTNTASAQPLTLPQDDKGQLQLLATVFTQSYGSYSNQSSLNNFDEIYSYMAASLKKWVQDTYKPQILKDHPLSAYYAIEAKVLNVQINKLDASAGTAQILIATQRQEFVGTPTNPKVYNQDLLLNAVKTNDAWIIASAYWQ